MRKIICLICLFILPAVSLRAQDEDYFKPGIFRYEDYTYHPLVKTVLFSQEGDPLSDPVLRLNGTGQLKLQFDWLNDEIMDFSYRIIHCDPEWHPSVLSESDFVDGFYTDHISEYWHSMNTLQEYWHYELSFPNSQMRPFISGNYLMVVFLKENPDSVVITRRFHVIEDKVDITTNFHRATDVEWRNTHQEADFRLNLLTLPVLNPYSDVKVIIVQNNNWNTRISGLKPLFAAENQLDYNLEEGNLFEGGSEFRNFDIRTTRFLTEFIDRFETDSISRKLTAVLKTDLRRATQRYSSAEDLNGKFLNKIYDGRDAKLEGDYLNVKFRLKAPEDFTEGSVYLEGQFTDWQLSPQYRMNCLRDSSIFEQTIYLKQGYYNYRYVVADKSGKNISTLETEGSHYETRNDYYFYVYWREQGGRYDRLIGYKVVSAGGW